MMALRATTLFSLLMLQCLAQGDSSLLHQIRTALPAQWLVSQKANIFTIIKSDSIWVKYYRGSVFRPKSYRNPCDSITDFELQMRCLQSHDASYSKIKYILTFVLEPKWSKEKRDSVDAFNRAVEDSFLIEAKKYPLRINGKSTDFWDTYWLDYKSKDKQKWNEFNSMKENYKSKIIELPYWKDGVSTSVFIANNRGLANTCGKHNENFIEIENTLLNLILQH